MSAAVNQVIIVGNLGRDPERKDTRNGKACVKLRVATTRKWRGEDGEAKEETDWHTVRVYGPQAEVCERYLDTGRLVCVEGRLHHYSWETEQKETRWGTEIVARRVHFLGARGRDGQGAGEPPPPRAASTTGSSRQPLF